MQARIDDKWNAFAQIRLRPCMNSRKDFSQPVGIVWSARISKNGRGVKRILNIRSIKLPDDFFPRVYFNLAMQLFRSIVMAESIQIVMNHLAVQLNQVAHPGDPGVLQPDHADCRKDIAFSSQWKSISQRCRKDHG
ncbi:hypothetical protein D3C78_1271750 [compost metagenome]